MRSRLVTHCDRARAVRWYVLFLAFTAVAVTSAIALRGAPWPRVGVMLVLAVLLGLCTNRFVLFPNETGATAEAAVAFVAIVVFRDEALLLGPLLLSLLVGLLDAGHWERRSFLRMAYNSGTQVFSVLAGIGGFALAARVLGSAWPGVLAATAIAAVPYMAVESCLGVILVVLQGESTRSAITHQVPVNSLAIPLALYGAAAALLGSFFGWWLTVLMLVPVPMIPELVLVQSRRIVHAPSKAVVVVAVSSFVTTVAFVPALRTPTFLAATAVLLGLESRPSRGAVPLLAAVAVVAALVLLPGRANFVFVPLVACSTVATSHALRRQWDTGACLRALIAAVPAAIVYQVVRGEPLPARTLCAALLGGIVFLFVASRRDQPVMWTAPIVGVAASVACLWNLTGDVGVLWFGFGMLLVLCCAATWGAPPWRSRVLGALPRRYTAWLGRPALLVAGVAAATASALSIAGSSSSSLCALIASVLGWSVVWMAACGVRQWRFAPRRRAYESAVLTLDGVVLAAFYVPLLEWWPLGSCIVLCAVVVVAVLIGWSVRPVALDGLVRDPPIVARGRDGNDRTEESSRGESGSVIEKSSGHSRS